MHPRMEQGLGPPEMRHSGWVPGRREMSITWTTTTLSI
jgi:hypothetical protein